MLSDSTNNEIFTVPMSVLVDSIYGDQHNTIPLPGGIQAAAPTSPLPMTMLDSLTVHAKMRFVTFIIIKCQKYIKICRNSHSFFF